MESSRYCLMFWFDGERSWSIQNATTIVKPRKDPERYVEGEKVFAKFRGKTYPAFVIRVNECKDEMMAASLKLNTYMKTDLDVDYILKEMGIGACDETEVTELVPNPQKETKSSNKVAKESTKRKTVVVKEVSAAKKQKTVANDRAYATKEACRQMLNKRSPISDEASVNASPRLGGAKHAMNDAGAEQFGRTDTNVSARSFTNQADTCVLVSASSGNNQAGTVSASSGNNQAGTVSASSVNNQADTCVFASSCNNQAGTVSASSFNNGADTNSSSSNFNCTDSSWHAPANYNWEYPSSASSNLASSLGFVGFLASGEDDPREERDVAKERDAAKKERDAAKIELFKSHQAIQKLNEDIRKKDARIRELEEEVAKKQIVTTPSKVRFLRSLAEHLSVDETNQTKSASRSILSSSPPPSRPQYSSPPSRPQYSSPPSRPQYSSPPSRPQYSSPPSTPQNNSPLGSLDEMECTQIHCHTSLPQMPDSDPTTSSPKPVDQEWSSPVTRSGERKEELVPGREVFLTRSQKASLSIGGFTESRKVALRILDMLFDQRTLAGMSAVGARKAYNNKSVHATAAVPAEVRNAIQEFVNSVCTPEEVARCRKELNATINSKCGTARRYLSA